MKTAQFILVCLVMTFFLAWAGTALAGGFVNLAVGTEKWFKDENHPAWRMHTFVDQRMDGYCTITEEMFDGQDKYMTSVKYYRTNAEGDIFFGGSEGDRFSNDILWVDAPLAAGKTWTDSRPFYPDNPFPPTLVHYNFAVIDQRTAVCTAGTFDCYMIAVTIICPGVPPKTETFWYNDECGLVRYDSYIASYRLSKVFVNGGYDSELNLHDGNQELALQGITSGPNPASPETSISFALTKPARVEVSIFDIRGRLVKRVMAGEQRQAGPVAVRWDGTDSGGRAVPSGTYLYRVKAGRTVQTDRITLVR